MIFSPDALPALKVLVVDDDRFNIRILEKYLAAPNILLETATNGKIAFEKIKQAEFDIIFMDIEMPVMNGWETVSAIRAYERSRGLSDKGLFIIALSAHDDSDSQQRWTDAGFTGFLNKPVKKEDIFKKLLQCAQMAPPIEDEDETAAADTQDPYTVKIDADLEEIIPSFLEKKTEELKLLQERFQEGDFEGVRQIGHRLKGTFNMYGFDAIGAAFSAVESAASLEDRATIETQLTIIVDSLGQLNIEYVEDE